MENGKGCTVTPMYDLVRYGNDGLRVGKDLVKQGGWLEVWCEDGKRVRGQWSPVSGHIFGALVADSGDRVIPLTISTTARVLTEEEREA